MHKYSREVVLDCGLDKSLREVAGTFTALYEAITDQAVAERLRVWSVGASAAPAEAYAVCDGHAACGVTLCGH